MEKKIEEILASFAVKGTPVEAKPYGSGHINDTYRVTTEEPDGTRHLYTLQRINHAVFRKPQQVMDNIERTLAHLGSKAAQYPDVKVLSLVHTREQRNCMRTFSGKWWRLYDFIDGVESYDNVRDPDIAFEAARGFAQFQNMMADLPAPRLYETIPYFHHTPMRYATLEEAAYQDIRNRADEVAEELEFVRQRRHLVAHLLNRYLRGQIPERITHNDTKINNALFDPTTKRCPASRSTTSATSAAPPATPPTNPSPTPTTSTSTSPCSRPSPPGISTPPASSSPPKSRSSPSPHGSSPSWSASASSRTTSRATPTSRPTTPNRTSTAATRSSVSSNAWKTPAKRCRPSSSVAPAPSGVEPFSENRKDKS